MKAHFFVGPQGGNFVVKLATRGAVFLVVIADESSRCKQFMADEAYTYSAVYYPRAVAMARLPMGLPAGLGLGVLIPMCQFFKSGEKKPWRHCRTESDNRRLQAADVETFANHAHV